jgi:hypothetical protein
VCFFWQDLYVGTNRFDLVTLVFDLYIQNFSHAYIFWMVCTWTLIFHMCVCCDKSFQWAPIDLTLWHWPLCLTYFLKTLALAFEWYVLEFWYFTVFLWQDLSVDTFKFDLLALAFVFDWLAENFNLGYIFWMVCTTTLIFHVSVPWDKNFPCVQTDLTLWPWCLIYIFKFLTLAITSE